MNENTDENHPIMLIFTNKLAVYNGEGYIIIRLFRESKMNVVACARLTFQMFNLLQKMSTPPEPVLKKHGTTNVWPC